MSERFESSGNPGAIGFDTTGGWSYGTYQLAHNNAKNFVDQSPFASEFRGLTFNSEAFRNKWQELAARDPQGFGAAQHDYIKRTHFDPQIRKIEGAGISASGFSSVLNDVIWSTAVQHGAGTDVIINALRRVGPNAPESQKIEAIYNERWSGGRRFASSTPAVQQSVRNRFFGPNGELNQALSMLG